MCRNDPLKKDDTSGKCQQNACLVFFAKNQGKEMFFFIKDKLSKFKKKIT